MHNILAYGVRISMWSRDAQGLAVAAKIVWEEVAVF